MGTVAVKGRRNRLTEYLRRTKNGEEIVVTERGKSNREPQSIHSVKGVRSLEAGLAKLAAQGCLWLPSRKPQRRIRAVKVAGGPLCKAIVEGRR